jgi:hypothetical protein
MTGHSKMEVDLKRRVKLLMSRLYETNLPLSLFKECWREIRDMSSIGEDLDQKILKDGCLTQGPMMNSEEEDELYEEVEAIIKAQERAEELLRCKWSPQSKRIELFMTFCRRHQREVKKRIQKYRWRTLQGASWFWVRKPVMSTWIESLKRSVKKSCI